MKYDDLKLIDELLCDLKASTGLTWRDLEQHTSITRAAMTRLREAWAAGEVSAITMSLALYLDYGENS